MLRRRLYSAPGSALFPVGAREGPAKFSTTPAARANLVAEYAALRAEGREAEVPALLAHYGGLARRTLEKYVRHWRRYAEPRPGDFGPEDRAGAVRLKLLINELRPARAGDLAARAHGQGPADDLRSRTFTARLTGRRKSELTAKARFCLFVEYNLLRAAGGTPAESRRLLRHYGADRSTLARAARQWRERASFARSPRPGARARRAAETEAEAEAETEEGPA